MRLRGGGPGEEAVAEAAVGKRCRAGELEQLVDHFDGFDDEPDEDMLEREEPAALHLSDDSSAGSDEEEQSGTADGSQGVESVPRPPGAAVGGADTAATVREGVLFWNPRQLAAAAAESGSGRSGSELE